MNYKHIKKFRKERNFYENKIKNNTYNNNSFRDSICEFMCFYNPAFITNNRIVIINIGILPIIYKSPSKVTNVFLSFTAFPNSLVYLSIHCI